MDISLTTKEKIGQRFMIGINNSNIDDIVYLIREYAIGGVILYRKNYQNYEDMLKVIKKLKEANKNNHIPLFIAIDQEGGLVNRLPKEIVNFRNINDLSKKGKSLVQDSAKLMSKILSQSGINMNLAPVMDIDNNSKSKVIYKRCFYGDVNDVCECSKKYIEIMKKENIISVCKHYPGHGISKMDSHFFVPYIFNYKKVLDRHIKPFKQIISEIDAIMVGHLIIRKMTKLLPASISREFIQKYLRKDYDGIIMTDEVKMLDRNILYRWNYLKNAMLAGNDIILIKIRDLNEGIKIMNRANKLFKDDILLDDSVNRIIKIKDKYNVNDNTDFNGIDIEKFNKEIIKMNEMI